jgi:FlaG/FlaF family flagellin (archaellin)
MRKVRPRLARNRHGVSEIIGNILILAITVTLFSSIMYFVTSMPQPHENAYADLKAQVGTNQLTHTDWVNITHNGGQELKGITVKIYLFVNNVPRTLNISDSNPSIGPTWTPGETWHYHFTYTGSAPTLTAMVVDVEKNSVIWQSDLVQGQNIGSSAPIIGSRGTTPSPTYEGDSFSFYASVSDSDGNLNTNSIYVDARAIGLPTALKMTDTNGDGIFTAACPLVASIATMNGKMVFINASDMTGLSPAPSRLVMSILQKAGSQISNQYGPYYNYSAYFVNGTYPPDVTGGESGGGSSGVSGTTFYYIRALPSYEIRKDFDPGEQVLIEVYSDALSNLGLENTFDMFHPLTGNAITPPSSTDAFLYGGIYGTFHRYIYNFTAPSTPYTYSIQMKFKDTQGTVVNIADTIQVKGANYPQLKVWKADPNTHAYIHTNSFNFTDRIYLQVITKDTDPILTTVSVGTIEVADYTGRYIIKLPPAAVGAYPTINYNPPVSSLFKTNAVSSTRVADNSATGIYTIYLEPKDAYQGWWLPRTNAYTLKITLISDQGPPTGEMYYDLATQVNITAPLSTTDIVASVGSGSFTWSTSGAMWDNSALEWYSSTERSDQWKVTSIDSSTYNGPIGMVLTDVDGDSKNDLIVGYQDSSVSIAWYRNELVDGSKWSNVPYIISPTFDAYPGSTPAGGTSTSNSNEDSSVYATRNNGFQTNYVCTYELVGAISSGNFGGRQGERDIVASFMHVVVYTTATSSGSANNGNSWGMFFNRGIYIFWDDGARTRTTLYSTDWWATSGQPGYNTANDNTNPAALDIATGDFNQDGYDDIVAVYETGATKVWFDKYLETGNSKTGAFGTAASLVTLTPTVPGTNPWDHVQKSPRVRVANIDTNGYPDIIRTSSASTSVYIFYTMPTSGGDVLFSPFKQYGTSTTDPTYAVSSGSIANLKANDSKYENITEVYANYPLDYAKPYQIGTGPGRDNTSQNIVNLQSDDGQTYNVNAGKTMYIASFAPNATYQTNQVSSCILRVKDSGDSSYLGGQAIRFSTNGGLTWTTTGIIPLANDNNVVRTYNLLTAGVNSYNAIQNLNIKFDSGGGGSVRFEYIWIEVKFVQSRQLECVWEVNNTDTQPLHKLTFIAKCAQAGEGFELAFSPDNSSWFNLTAITSTTEKTYVFMLDHTTNDKYYLRVTDLDRSGADAFNNTLCVNMVQIDHYSPNVIWSNTYRTDVALPATGLSGEFITAIAVGDLGKTWGDHMPDGYNDIVVATSVAGTTSGSSNTATGGYHSVYVLAQRTGGGGFDILDLYTPVMQANVADNHIYNIINIELGDINGDYTPDIVLVIGVAPGESPGSATSLWLIENDPLPGAWQFTDRPINVLVSGESAINVVTGYVDLTIFLPFFGAMGIVIAGVATEQIRKRRGQ